MGIWDSTHLRGIFVRFFVLLHFEKRCGVRENSSTYLGPVAVEHWTVSLEHGGSAG
jgi:hypothetical protein